MKLAAWSDNRHINDGRCRLQDFTTRTIRQEIWTRMVTLTDVFDAALIRDGLLLSGATQEFVRATPRLRDVPLPNGLSERQLVVPAGIMELLAVRTGQAPPSWTATVGGLPEPFFLVAEAETMTRLRVMCQQESPEPLRKRGLLAPPQYLSWA